MFFYILTLSGDLIEAVVADPAIVKRMIRIARHSALVSLHGAAAAGTIPQRRKCKRRKIFDYHASRPLSKLKNRRLETCIFVHKIIILFHIPLVAPPASRLILVIKL